MRKTLVSLMSAAVLAAGAFPMIASAQVADQVTLQSIVLTPTQVHTTYKKNFATCVHMVTANYGIIHTQNHFCANGPITITVPRTAFSTAMQVGAKFKLCHGNNYGVCSQLVTVTAGQDPKADMMISKTGLSAVTQGQQLVYTLTARNLGPATAQNVKVTDVLPASLTFQSAPGCTVAGTTVSCVAGTMTSGQSKTFTITVGTANVPCQNTIVNTANVSSTTPDPNTANNSYGMKTTIMCQTKPTADLSISKAAASTVQQGTNLVYTLVAKNNGPNTAASIGITDQLPNGLTIISAPGCTFNATMLTCVAGNMASGASRTFTVTTDTSGASCNVVLKNYAQIGSSTMDPNTANNTSNTVSTTVTCQTAQNELNITVKSGPSSDIAVKNEKNIRLLGFEARGDHREALITDLRFTAESGNLTNAQNYKLWVDTTGDNVVDTILQSGVATQGGLVTFSQLAGGGYVVPSTASVLFEVRADVAASLSTPESLQLKFATALTNYVEAEDVPTGALFTGIKTNGVCASTCQITVTTVPSTNWTLVSQGNLFVTKSVTPVRSQMLLGGSSGSTVLRVDFRAEYEPVEVTNLVFTAIGANASSTQTNVDRLELFRVGEFTPFAIATVGGCGATPVPANSFCSNTQSQQLVVQEGSTTAILVKARMRTDVDGATSGQEVTFKIVADSNTVSGSVRARGVFSSNNLQQNDNDSLGEGEVFIGTSYPAAGTDIVGTKNVVVLSKVFSITNADPNSNGTVVPTGTQRAIGQFKFKAALHNNSKNGLNKFTVDGLIFNVNATNVAMNAANFKFYNKADSTTKAVCTPKTLTRSTIVGTATGTFYVECSSLTSTSFVNTQIDQNTDQTFVLEGEITNAKVSNSLNSVLQTSIQQFTDIAASAFGLSASHVKWFDMDTTSTTFLWIEYPDTTVSSTRYEA